MVYERLLRPLLFRLDAETAHNWGLRTVAMGLVRTRLVADPRLQVRALGTTFPNPIGLAAGFDKNAVALPHWPRLGFGFVEVGTLTPRPQPGNPKPRMFRLPEDHAIINRLGFNNLGAASAAQRIRSQPLAIPLGVNLGKNKDTTPEAAAEDYALAHRALVGLGTYTVVNVSSPNTPGLRNLQDAESLRAIVSAIRAEEADRTILIKLAPDLERSAVEEAAGVCRETGCAGLIVTNTTLSREGLRSPLKSESGGLSGRPLAQKSEEVLSWVAAAAPDLTTISVGGIMSGQDVYRRLRAGAKLVQIYTGWVYGGPGTVPRMLLELLDCMERDSDGPKNVESLAL
jgi:dihydroorotate dehydrogenase